MIRRTLDYRIHSLGKVVYDRLKYIGLLGRLLLVETTEKPFQKLLEKAPWIIAPSYAPITQDKSLDGFRSDFEFWYEKTFGESIHTSAIENGKKEPDFIFIKDDNQIIIVEIKKPNYALSEKEYKRAFDYLHAVRGFLESKEKLRKMFVHPRLIIICDDLNLHPSYIDSIKHDPNVERLTWTTIYVRVRRRYADYFDKLKKMRAD